MLRFVLCIALSSTTAAINICEIALAADDHKELRQAWDVLRAEHDSVCYEATGARSAPAGQDPNGPAKSVRLRIRAQLNLKEGKCRFDVSEDDRGLSEICLLDGAAFYTCRQAAGEWTVASGPALERDSAWLQVYPILLAHGVVPIPPFQAPRITKPVEPRSSETTGSLSIGEAVFEFTGDPPVTVSVIHDREGRLSRYRATSKGQRLLEIDNTYRREAGFVRLDGYQLISFSPAGTIAMRVEGRAEKCQFDVPLPAGLFAQPRATADLRAALMGLLAAKARVEFGMKVDSLAGAIQAACGKKLSVNVDREALARFPETDGRAIRLEPGDAPLSELLFSDLRRNHMDFCFDVQGISLIPRGTALQHPEFAEYRASDFGLSARELQTLIHDSATSFEDWSDVGGAAQMTVDEEKGIVSVFHAQSDHFQFRRKLAELKKTKPP